MDNFNHRTMPTPEPDDQDLSRRAAALDAHIAALQAGQHPSLPDDVPPEDLPSFLLAARLQGAATSDPTPDPQFVATLGAQLETQLKISQDGQISSVTTPAPLAPVARRRPSRRMLLTSGIAAAAGIAVGVGSEIVREQAITPSGWDVPLVGQNGTWLAVARVSDVAPGSALRFTTPTIAGHLIRAQDGTFYALSAACTHMGCLLNWNAAQRTFDCPCHAGRFDTAGQPLPSHTIVYRPLPTMQTRIMQDQIYVLVPTSNVPADGYPSSP